MQKNTKLNWKSNFPPGYYNHQLKIQRKWHKFIWKKSFNHQFWFISSLNFICPSFRGPFLWPCVSCMMKTAPAAKFWVCNSFSPQNSRFLSSNLSQFAYSSLFPTHTHLFSYWQTPGFKYLTLTTFPLQEGAISRSDGRARGFSPACDSRSPSRSLDWAAKGVVYIPRETNSSLWTSEFC